MENIFIIGHKNPDSDSICSAIAYSYLKNRIDSENRYIPMRCGNINSQTKFILESADMNAPAFVSDIYPKVKDVMSDNVVSSDENSPVFNVMKNIEDLKIRMTPIVDINRKIEGIVSILEITDYFMSDNLLKKPVYIFRPENFKKVIDGYFYKKGISQEFSASVMVGAMPFERYVNQMKKLDLKKTILVVGKRRDIIEFAVENEVPAIILTGFTSEADVDVDFENYSGWVYVSNLDTAETLRRLALTVPAKYLMSSDIPVIKPYSDLSDAKNVMLTHNRRGLIVVDDNDELVGIVTRSDVLKSYKQKMIMVDHNELSQAVEGAESAEIVEIVDHHRLGTIKTSKPIQFLAKPVGSTCSIIYEQFKNYDIKPENGIAMLLLSGILSDTVMLKSPTTTACDISFVEELSGIIGLDYKEYGKEMFYATDSLKSRKPSSVIKSDFKEYSEFERNFGIGQVEVVNLNEIEDMKQIFIEALDDVCKERKLDFAMLLVTDIINTNSILLVTEFKEASWLTYRRIDENTFDLPGVLSRKKQLLPEVLRVLEERSEK
jgi:manganese-dependent inorganic pyrophosphatase